MLNLAELGLPGLALLVSFLGAAGWGALQARRLGPGAAVVAAAGLGAGAQWLLPASYDWFWQYPGVTAPALFLLGVGMAPALLAPGRAIGRVPRLAVGGTALLVALVCLPAFVTDRYISRADSVAEADPAAAIADLRRAADLAPLDPQPLIRQAELHMVTDHPRAALVALEEAREREPLNYRANFLIALLLKDLRDPAAAAAIERAERLNPLEAEFRESS